MANNFFDEIRILVKSGDGGNGACSFRREKFIEMGGPDGGDGGKGGDVIIVVDHSINTFAHFRYKKHFEAQNGENGKSANKTGKSGEDLIIPVPLGTQIYSEDGLLMVDLVHKDQRLVIAQGGHGGVGNARFKSSVNRAPRRIIPGQDGVEVLLELKLKIIADIGIIGLPNAGKSSFLAAVTAAKPKIANYAFTTLSPNLGVIHGYDSETILADIPGLIEGAHLGHGLGDRFLKHLERCKTLLHLIDIGNGPQDQLDIWMNNIIKNYQIVRNEMSVYSSALLEKREVICLNKCEGIESEILTQIVAMVSARLKTEVFAISNHSRLGIDVLLQHLIS
ncbi:GTPase Obg [Rickettsiales endosymbiont of Paramecium tredecaurelia]|uniref:GTPase ObgE n=1 Tax=Candidatus Sarmatiella mevalonica TaxID=2770581 RepID=UPI0019243F25|nr:GTPase ObgE [Candidatus Sarmatiella mevalonica]MBL3284857.1 GTPase Obg [Candidatus Sarmatiella mevalonica]